MKVADPYLVWNIASEKVIMKVTNSDNTVHAVLHELTCNTTKSRPTGTFNESLTKVIRGSSVQYKQRQVVKTKDGNRLKWGDRIRKNRDSKQEMRLKRAKAREERKLRNEDASDGDNDAE